MKKTIRILILVTVLLLTVGMLAACDPPSELTHEKDISEAFSAISIDAEAGSTLVSILPATDGKNRVTGAMCNGFSLTTTVVDGALCVSVEDARPFLTRWISTRPSAVSIYLSEGVYGALTVLGSTGDVTVGENLAFENITIDISTGDVTLSSVMSKNDLTIDVSTGDVTLTEVAASKNIMIEQSTGRAALSGVSSENLTIKGSTGELSLSELAILEALTIERTTGDTVAEQLMAGSILAKADTADMSFSDATVLGEYSVTTTTGKQTHTDISAETVTADASTGAVSLSNVKTVSWLAAGTTSGHITLANTVAGGLMKLRASSGDIDLDRIDAGEIDIETSSGHVKGTILTEKVFIVRSSSGKITAPETTTGGKCRVETSSGRITLSLALAD